MSDMASRTLLYTGAAGGLGLPTTVLFLAAGARVVAVDNDPEVVRLGRASFYLTLPGVSVVLADAFQFAAACRGRFDYIAVDLFRGNERPRDLAGRPFLRDLHRMRLEPRDGRAVGNQGPVQGDAPMSAGVGANTMSQGSGT